MDSSGGGLFVPPGDDAALAAAILSLSRDKAKAQRMGQAARDYVVRHFDRNAHAREFTALVEKMGAEPNP
jgi:glycosyltransferase involved in cell wall biosynthesis